MRTGQEVVLEICAVSVLNIAAVYVAAFVYHLNWWGILGVMVVASLLTAYLSDMFVKRFKTDNEHVAVSDSNSIIIITGATSLAVLLILSLHFNLPMALGISLLSGLETTFWKQMLFN